MQPKNSLLFQKNNFYPCGMYVTCMLKISLQFINSILLSKIPFCYQHLFKVARIANSVKVISTTDAMTKLNFMVLVQSIFYNTMLFCWCEVVCIKSDHFRENHQTIFKWSFLSIESVEQQLSSGDKCMTPTTQTQIEANKVIFYSFRVVDKLRICVITQTKKVKYPIPH